MWRIKQNQITQISICGVVILLLSWCWLNQESRIDALQRSEIETSYTHQVDHNKQPYKDEFFTIEAKQQDISFYTNKESSNLRTYGTWSEPLVVRASVWDKLHIKAINSLPDPTTIHWHGIRVPLDQDGVPWISQDPIQPWATYDYMFSVWDPWTYWFHSHIDTAKQVAKWLYGILIVEDERFANMYDQERVRALKDYRLEEDWSLNEDFVVGMDHTMWGRLWNTRTINNEILPVYTAKAWDIVLLRLVNTSSARIYNLDLRQRKAKVVESDGWPIQTPYEPWVLQMGVGERYTLLVEIPDDAASLELVDIYYPEPSQLAVIDIEWNTIKTWQINTYTWDASVPDRRVLEWATPDFQVELGGMNVSGWDKMLSWWDSGWTINNKIHQEWDMMTHTNPLFSLQRNTLYTIRLNNNSQRDHPMHLHGDFFQVVWVNGRERPYAGRKDTVNVPAQWHTDIAIIPTNPWTWMFHCHINEHAEYGMMATLKIE